MIVESSITIDENVAESESWIRYLWARCAAAQLRTAGMGISADAFAGVASCGTSGLVIAVTNCRISEYPEIPFPFFAFTRQKYRVRLICDGTARVVPATVESSSTSDGDANDESVAHWTR